jgi:diguanylate cyclase (GGDEF)-like protein
VEPADARLRLRSVARLARVLAEPRPLLDLLELAGREVRFALGAAAVSLGRLERERGHLRVLVNVGQLAPWERERPEHEVYSVVDLPMNVVLVDEVRSYTVSADDPFADESVRLLLGELGMGSCVAAPILLDGAVWGELWATRRLDEPRFEDADREVAEALAAVLAAGIGQSDRLMRAERLINTDVLTGLANRRAVEQALEVALAGHHEDAHPVSVVMADVNGLKATNDQDGHEAGDALIKECARAVSKALHVVPGGLAGRIGGDEFCVVLDGYGLARAEAFAAEVLRLLAQGPRPRALAVGVASTESPGARTTGEPVTPRRLMRWADEAQYAAKRQGSGSAMVAGREVPLAEPVERRRRRRQPATPPRAAERAAVALDASLRVLADPEGPHDPLPRLLAALDEVVDTLGACGWLVGSSDGRQVSTVAFSASRDGLAVDAVLPLPPDGWAAAAAAAGVLSSAGDSSVPLADLRGCGSVAAASAGAWWVEVFADPPAGLDGVPAVLRSLVCVAVAG